MKIYHITPDNSCWTLVPTDPHFFSDPFTFKLKPMAATWADNPKFYIKDPVRTQRSDFVNLTGGMFAFMENVNQSSVGKIIRGAGEVLSGAVERPSVPVHFFNGLACYDCLDHARCMPVMTPGVLVYEIIKYALHPAKIGESSLFKIPESYHASLFAVSGRHPAEEDFFVQYHALGLKGLVFKEVWSDEFGPA